MRWPSGSSALLTQGVSVGGRLVGLGVAVASGVGEGSGVAVGGLWLEWGRRGGPVRIGSGYYFNILGRIGGNLTGQKGCEITT